MCENFVLILSFLMLLALNLPAVPVYFSGYWPFAVKHAATSFRAFLKGWVVRLRDADQPFYG